MKLTYPIITRGHTLCPNCSTRIPATWVKIPAAENDVLGPARYMYDGQFSTQLPERIRMQFKCECGCAQTPVVFSDARYFYTSQPAESGGGCGSACACRASDNTPAAVLGTNGTVEDPQALSTDHFAKLMPCVVLMEIVKSCNWSCGTCLASSLKETSVTVVPLEEVKRRLKLIIDRHGKIELLQLSGGEPTLHPQFFQILGWCQSHPKINVVMINTNGSKLVDDSFTEHLRGVADPRKVHLYLKFNGPNPVAQQTLANGNFHPHELRLLQKLPSIGLSTTLAMTVVQENLPHVWDVACLGMGCPVVKGVNYQPRFGGGRVADTIKGLVDAGHVTNHLVDRANQGDDRCLSETSIIPLPCGDPNCAFTGWVHRETGECMIREIEPGQRVALTAFLADRINYLPEQFHGCGCEESEAGAIHTGFETLVKAAFRLSIKPFMTFGQNWNCNRTGRCCTGVVGTNGELDSFCKVYNGQSDIALW